MKRWFKTLAGKISPPVAIVMPPDGAAPRGFQGKNAFADQFNLIGPGARVIVDAGAHTGDSAARYLELFASARIHCFEPFPDSFARLAARFSGHNRVVPHQCALSDGPGESSFHTFVASVANSLLPAAKRIDPFVPRDQMRETGVITVQNVTLDEFCRSERINRIDILKLDIQGGELRALKGAARLLSERRVRLVYAEGCSFTSIRGKRGLTISRPFYVQPVTVSSTSTTSSIRRAGRSNGVMRSSSRAIDPRAIPVGPRHRATFFLRVSKGRVQSSTDGARGSRREDSTPSPCIVPQRRPMP
jgi:FkbM family methyltransferase